MDQPEGDADQHDYHSADEQLRHRLSKLDRIEGMTLGFLDRQARTDGQNASGDADSRDDKKGDQIGNTYIVGRGDEKSGDGSENFHDNENEKDFVDDRNEGRKEGLMVEHRIQNVVNEIDRDCTRDH